jgi:hypothetical protein
MTAHESNTSGPIFIGSLDLAKPAPQHDRLAVRRAAEWLSLGAAPTFAFMAALTAVLGGGVHEMSCATGSPTSALSGMVPMYVLMSACHFAPWLKLIYPRRSGAPAADLTQQGGMLRSFREATVEPPRYLPPAGRR